jgi:aminopeptidase C
MTREEKAKFLAQVREFVLSMTRIEAAMPTLGERLTKDERKEAFKEIFEWLESTMEIPPNSFAREWARELLAHIGVLAQYDTYEGSADSYIA